MGKFQLSRQSVSPQECDALAKIRKRKNKQHVDFAQAEGCLRNYPDNAQAPFEASFAQQQLSHPAIHIQYMEVQYHKNGWTTTGVEILDHC